MLLLVVGDSKSEVVNSYKGTCFFVFAPHQRDMLAIHLWGPLSLIDNLWIAMLMEVVKVKPQQYCIYFDDSLEFYNMFQLILYSLLQERMFLYPAGSTLGGPFLHEPW